MGAVLLIGVASDHAARIYPLAHEIADAVRRSPTMPAMPAGELRRRLAAALGDTVPVDAVIAATRIGLTAQQAELLGYLLLGLTNQQIADAMATSEATVKYRLTRLYRRVRVGSRSQAVERAQVEGLAAAFEPHADRLRAVAVERAGSGSRWPSRLAFGAANRQRPGQPSGPLRPFLAFTVGAGRDSIEPGIAESVWWMKPHRQHGAIGTDVRLRSR
jgi:DNA-binding CsgD family transcriptional regulator